MLMTRKYLARIPARSKIRSFARFGPMSINAYDPRFQREAIAPIPEQARSSCSIRGSQHLGQVKAKVEIPFIMEHERLLIANLSKGQLGHDKRTCSVPSWPHNSSCCMARTNNSKKSA